MCVCVCVCVWVPMVANKMFFLNVKVHAYIAAICSTRIGRESIGLAAMPSFESLLIPLVQMNAPKARFFDFFVTFAEKTYDMMEGILHH